MRPQLYQRVPVLDSGARGSTTTFAQNKNGDVHLTWENEALLEVQESEGRAGDRLSVGQHPGRAVRRRGGFGRRSPRHARRGRGLSQERVSSQEAQEIIARHGYRPIDDDVLARAHKDTLPDLTLFPMTSFVKDGWGEAQTEVLRRRGVFDQIYQPGK